MSGCQDVSAVDEAAAAAEPHLSGNALSHSRLRRDGLLVTDDAADASDGGIDGIGATEPRNTAEEVGVTHFRQK